MTPKPLTRSQKRWIAGWITVSLVGLVAFIIGINPDLIGMNRSPAVGFVQIGVWLIGLAILLVGAYGAVRTIRRGRPKSLRADIGLRLLATGYVIAMAASAADFIGIGSHRQPNINFGRLQILGLLIGIGISLLGVLLYMPLGRSTGAEDPEN
ncbi:MAG: hypothetical protein PVJ32_04420 [Anaerolineales bacterium]|jgi:uncharacterized membrane protein